MQYEYMEIRDALALERQARAKTTYLSLFSNRGNFRRMRIIIGTQFPAVPSPLLLSFTRFPPQRWDSSVNGGELNTA